jgi:hypothetical protein
MRFIGRCNKSHSIPSTGVIHTNRPWFRRILALQGDVREGTRIELGRYRQWAEIAEEGRHRGWTNTGMIPNETPKVERYEDFLPFHDHTHGATWSGTIGWKQTTRRKSYYGKKESIR